MARPKRPAESLAVPYLGRKSDDRGMRAKLGKMRLVGFLSQILDGQKQTHRTSKSKHPKQTFSHLSIHNTRTG